MQWLAVGAIAVAGDVTPPGTAFRLDTIYTERYMRRPQDNPAGYDAGSVAKAAGKLSGRLLIAHGLLDDNVHPQNAFQLCEALQQAGKPFELMVYPGKRHEGYGRPFGQLKFDFIKRSLGGPQVPAGAAP